MLDWKEICKKCADGEMEPECEYYGEPNGCNSPMYHEHPPVCNAAAMRACLLRILAEMTDLGGMEFGRKAHFSPDAIAAEIRDALVEPPRNCDVYAKEEARMAYHLHGDGLLTMQAVVDWLYSVNEERGDESPRTGQESEMKK